MQSKFNESDENHAIKGDLFVFISFHVGGFVQMLFEPPHD